MKKIFFILIASFLLSAPCLAGEWNLTGSLNQGRSQFCSITLNDGRILIAGGSNLGSLSSCEIYDPDNDEWSITDSMHCLRHDFSLTKLPNGKILATGGYNGGIGEPTTISEIFDPETETWTMSGELNYFRGHHTTVLLQNNKVLVVGGDAVNEYKGCEIYDIETEMFALTGFCSYAKTNHSTELFSDGRVMAIGGGNSSYEHCEIYDPDAELWTEIASLNEPRYSHTSHLLPNGNVMAIAGRWGNHYNSSCEIYDFQTQEWTYADSLEIGRTNHCSEKLLNNKILVMGGHSDQIGTDMTCEIYDYEINEWQIAASFNASYYNFSSEILNDERVLVMKACCEIYIWNYQPVVSQPQGPSTGSIGEELVFSVTTTDPDNDSIAIRIDWGDDQITEWTELQPSGITFELSHSWSEPGTYQVHAQSADQWFFLNEECHNSISDWSEPTIITITATGVDPDPHSPEPMLFIYPNPFRTSTTISFSNQQSTISNHPLSITIFNIKGQVVKTFQQSTINNQQSVLWNGKDDAGKSIANGIYFCKLSTGKFSATQRIILLK